MMKIQKNILHNTGQRVKVVVVMSLNAEIEPADDNLD
jgi:hypothetical protein